MIVEFSIVPMGKGVSLSRHVALVIDEVDRSGLDYRLTPMGTVVEGEPRKVFDLLFRCHMLMRKRSARVLTTIRIDDRQGAKGAISKKVASVEKKLKRPVKK
jgi:uncharacterized protein (TIGR00106 family)